MGVKLRFSGWIAVSLLFLSPLFVLADPAGISAAGLQAWLDEDNPPLLLDARGSEVYRTGTLPGAVNAGRDPAGYLPDDSREPVVLILPTDADAGLIDRWHRRLVDAGHPVRFLDAGVDGWIEAGGEIEIPDSIYPRPGRVPFIIPRGLCEGNTPAQIFQ